MKQKQKRKERHKIHLPPLFVMVVNKKLAMKDESDEKKSCKINNVVVVE